MPKTFTTVTRALVFILALAAPGLVREAAAQPQQQQPQQSQGQRPPKKKLQANASFAQYAGRDASNRLIAGGATRDIVDETKALTAKGEESLDAGRPEEAIAPLKRVTELKPESATAFYNLGTAYEAAGRNKDAVAAYRRAVELADRSEMTMESRAQIKAMSYYNMGNTLSADNQPKQAVEPYKQVVMLMPNQPVAHYNLGLAYASSGQGKEAVESFKKSIELFPPTIKDAESQMEPEDLQIMKGTYANAYFNLGNVYGSLEQYSDAVEAFKQAVKIKPDHAEAHFHLGIAYLNLDDKPGAQAEIKSLESLKPELAAKLKSVGN